MYSTFLIPVCKVSPHVLLGPDPLDTQGLLSGPGALTPEAT